MVSATFQLALLLGLLASFPVVWSCWLLLLSSDIISVSNFLGYLKYYNWWQSKIRTVIFCNWVPLRKEAGTFSACFQVRMTFSLWKIWWLEIHVAVFELGQELAKRWDLWVYSMPVLIFLLVVCCCMYLHVNCTAYCHFALHFYC